MNKRYKHIIFFDTEFISTRRKNQPIEISLVAYDIVDNKLKYDKSFSTYILLEKGVYLNKYVTAFTGINNEVLDKYGIRIKDAKEQFLYFLLGYSPKDTLLAGWSISNDIFMFDILCNKDESIANISKRYNFSNVIYFERLFKKIMGKSPSQYKKENIL
jgi:inhibitor of KinA sporulation pathway (predicted exonuclease)